METKQAVIQIWNQKYHASSHDIKSTTTPATTYTVCPKTDHQHVASSNSNLFHTSDAMENCNDDKHLQSTIFRLNVTASSPPIVFGAADFLKFKSVFRKDIQKDSWEQCDEYDVSICCHNRIL
jgi:hypothetical protein